MRYSAAFSALRAFVLSRSKLLGILVFALSLAPVGANLVSDSYSGFLIPDGLTQNRLRCRYTMPTSPLGRTSRRSDVPCQTVHPSHSTFGSPRSTYFSVHTLVLTDSDKTYVGYHSSARARTHTRNGTVVIIARVPLIIADLLLICITWTKLSSGQWGARKGIRQSERPPLFDILFRGGMSLIRHSLIIVIIY